MPLVINTNVASLQAQKNLNSTQSALASSFNRLSSGYRINSAKDDAAGLAVSENMRMQIRSYSVAERNANDGISMAQTAEGALGSVSDILGRMRELAMQGSNGSLQSADRDYLNTEFNSLKAEVSRILTSTKFNGRQLLGAASSAVEFQVGIGNQASDRITLTFGGVALTALTTASTTLSGNSAAASRSALDAIDNALKTVSTNRAKYGAAMNRLEITTSNLQTERLNISAANSRIKDVDVAEETASLARTQVLSQAGASILAQANQAPNTALGLLR
jgi:flagellin